MSRVKAYAKINLGLVVGPIREDGKHEVVTVLQRIDLHDDIALEPATELTVEGFPEDTLAREALAALAQATGVAPSWRVRIEKRIPIAAGLGGSSSDAAAALILANARVPEPLPPDELHRLASRIGVDVPFFLRDGPVLAAGDGSELAPLELPQDYFVVLALPDGETKESTEAVYERFDERGGADEFDDRRAAVLEALAGVRLSRDLAALPRNDLASSPLVGELERLGAFRADVTGAGPAVYGLFERREDAEAATATLRSVRRAWVVRPVAGR